MSVLEILKTEHAVKSDYTWAILSRERINETNLKVRLDISCPKCDQEGQFYWQIPDKTRLEFYCPNCNITWTIFKKEN